MQSIIRRVSVKAGAQTLMSYIGEHPLRAGNEFTLKMFDDSWAWVQNISAEDFQEICKRKNLYSVSALYIPEHNMCFIIDDRIPWDWYRDYEPLNDQPKFKVSDVLRFIEDEYEKQGITFQSIDYGGSFDDLYEDDEYEEDGYPEQLKFNFTFKNE